MENSTANTPRQYREVIAVTKSTFVNKNKKYGRSWIVIRPFSILDQAWIKIKRIRTVQEKQGMQKITDEPLEEDFDHIINYCVMGIIRCNHSLEELHAMPVESLIDAYDTAVNLSLSLCENKNDDYGEAWRELHISSMVDLMLAKHLRGGMMHSQGILGSNDLLEILKDIMNYAVFCRIRINEGSNPLL